MVRRALLLLALVLLATPGLAQPKGQGGRAARAPAPYELDRSTLALGEPLQLRITRALDSREAPLESLDLAPLQRDFELLERTLGRDSTQETLTLTLYARRTGRFELPTLGRPGRAPQVTVSEGSDGVPRVQWKLSLDPPEPLLRQPTTFTLEACDDGSLLWKRPTLAAPEGLLLRPLHETEIITTRDGQRCTAHRWHWALLPTASGELALALPVMEAGKFGRRLRFAPPALALRAQPLPAWLPHQAAVGPPGFVAEPLPPQAVLAQPLAWRLRVRGAYSAAALQELLDWQLREADERLGLQAYAPLIEPQPSTEAAPQYRVTLYLAPRAAAVLALPALQLPWYDPASGQLRQQALALAQIEVLDPQRRRWQLVAGVAAGVLAGGALAALLWHLLAWRLRRWRAARQVLRAPDVEALCAVLRGFGRRRGEAAAPTLGSWQQRMVQRLDLPGLAALVQALEQARFGPAGAAAADLPALARQASLCLRAARRMPPARQR